MCEISPVLLPKALIIFEIPLPLKSKNAYMQLKEPQNYMNGNTVIFVSSHKFASRWANPPKKPWNKDRKFKYAEDGFSHGSSNPVPLASISSVEAGKIYIRDGLTRTIWLLENKAWSFPIHCPDEFADELQTLAGA